MLKLGLIQMAVAKGKEENVSHACQLIKDAAKDGADMVVLPECFNCPYSTSLFAQYAEEIPGATSNVLSSTEECGIYIIGGLIPERDGHTHKLYNSCAVFDPSGRMVAKYHKMYLADTFVPGQLVVKESDVFTEGDTSAIIDTAWCSVGIGICRDLRYPELALHYAKEGCSILCYPSAYNVNIGSAHWELMLRAR